MRTTTVNIHEAKTNLSRLLPRVGKEEEVIIAKAGKPLVRLVPIAKFRSMAGSFDLYRGPVWIAPDFDAPLAEDVPADFEGRESCLTRTSGSGCSPTWPRCPRSFASGFARQGDTFAAGYRRYLPRSRFFQRSGGGSATSGKPGSSGFVASIPSRVESRPRPFSDDCHGGYPVGSTREM